MEKSHYFYVFDYCYSGVLVSLSGMAETPRLQAKKSFSLSLCDVIEQVPTPRQI
jgi:hypothetical protein